MRISATQLELFRLYREQDYIPESELIASIKGIGVQNEKMRLGIAFENILMDPDAYLVPGGYRSGDFSVDRAQMDPCLDLIDRRGVFQVKTQKAYGPHDVVAKADQVLGTEIHEWKTRDSSAFQIDNYLESYQWRFELDLFYTSMLTYHLFLLDNHGNGVVEVRRVETFSTYRYPALHADCADLVYDFTDYVTTRQLTSFLDARQREAANG